MKYTVIRSCGCEEEVDLYGTKRDQDYWRGRYEGTPCDKCREKMRDEQAAKAKEAAKAAGLPDLIGTPKQIRWAEQLREELLPKFEARIESSSAAAEAKKEGDPRKASIMLQALASLKDMIREKADASWWIENRYGLNNFELNRLYDKRVRELLDLEKIPMAQVEAEQEAILQKEGADRGVLVEIRKVMDHIEAITSENDDEANGCLKAAGFHWDEWKEIWMTDTHPMYGNQIDRGAEAACKLLNDGYAVRIYNEEIRRKALAADYEPVRWYCISYIPEKDLLDIRWKPWDGREYDFAKRLTGSRYEKPGILIHPQRYLEVLDFAELRGYWITDDARAAMERHMHPEYVDVAPAQPGYKPVRKKAQVSMEVPDDLYDD